MSKSTLKIKLPIKFIEDDPTVKRDKFCSNGRIEIDYSKISEQINKAVEEDRRTNSGNLSYEISQVGQHIVKELQRRLKNDR